MINKTSVDNYRLNGVFKINNLIDRKTILTLKKNIQNILTNF